MNEESGIPKRISLFLIFFYSKKRKNAAFVINAAFFPILRLLVDVGHPLSISNAILVEYRL